MGGVGWAVRKKSTMAGLAVCSSQRVCGISIRVLALIVSYACCLSCSTDVTVDDGLHAVPSRTASWFRDPHMPNTDVGTIGQNSLEYGGVSDGTDDDLSPYAPVSAPARIPGRQAVQRINQIADPPSSIYVSPQADPLRATGSVDQPYASINVALEDAQPGDNIVLLEGTYREGVSVRIRTPNITIKSAYGQWAVIDLTHPDPQAIEDSGIYFDVDSTGSRLQGLEVIGGYYAVSIETRWDWGDPDNRAGASNIIVEDSILHHSQYDVVKIKPGCDNIIIRNNVIHASGQAFSGNPRTGEDNAEGIDIVNADNVLIQGNYIYDIVSNGIYAKGGSTNTTIEFNLIENVSAGGILVGFDTSPEYFDLEANPHFYENMFAVVRENLVIGSGWEGIGFYAAAGAHVSHNTLINVTQGGMFHSGIYFGLSYQDWEPYAGRPPSKDISFHNNIVSQSPDSSGLPMIEIRYSDELGGLSALQSMPNMEGNCYSQPDGQVTFTDMRPSSLLNMASFRAWQAHSGTDSTSVEESLVFDQGYQTSNPSCSGISWSLTN